MSCSLQFIETLSQRKQQFFLRTLTLTNSNRVEMENPYLTNSGQPTPYSQFDLDMRRKAEILQYNKSAEKVTNKSTSVRWVDVVRSRGKRIIASSRTGSNCPTNVPTPLYSSDVPSRPGDPLALYLDPNVPLYNYINAVNNRNYDAQSINNPEFVYNVNPTSTLGSGSTSVIASIMFNTTILHNTYYLSLTIPIAFQITNFTTITNMPITITPIISIYYNEQLVYNVPTNLMEYSYADLILTAFSTPNQLTQYIGTVSTNNIAINAIPNIVYTVRLRWDIKTVENVSMSSAILLGNIPPSFVNTSNNASISSTNSLPVMPLKFVIHNNIIN